MEHNESSESLETCLRRHAIQLQEDQVRGLEQYCTLLWEWNDKLNLTRHTTFEKFVTRDVLDTLELSKQIESGRSVMDVGSGGGVPGLALAILRPDLRVVLTEPVGKKARALEDMVERLKLTTKVQAVRAEELISRQRFDVVIARAVGPLWQMLKWFQSHWDHIGALLVIKGPRWVEERGEARHRGLLKPLELRVVATYPMPGTDSQSVILKIWPKADSEDLRKPAKGGSQTSA